MEVLDATFEKCNGEALSEFLTAASRPEGTLNYPELLGFLYAVVCAPESIAQAEWLEQIFGGQAPGFEDARQEAMILDALDCLYQHLDDQVQDDGITVPFDLATIPRLMDHFTSKSPLHHWANGFIAGHAWLEELWEELPEDIDDEIGACTMVMSFFADLDLARSYHKEFAHSDESFEEMAASMLEEQEDAMISYADIGKTLRSDFAELE